MFFVPEFSEISAGIRIPADIQISDAHWVRLLDNARKKIYNVNDLSLNYQLSKRLVCYMNFSSLGYFAESADI